MVRAEVALDKVVPVPVAPDMAAQGAEDTAPAAQATALAAIMAPAVAMAREQVMVPEILGQGEELGPEGLALGARIWANLAVVREARALDFIPAEHQVPEANSLPSVVPAPKAETRAHGTLSEAAAAALHSIRMLVGFG
jgi:hypothetical protein